MLGFISCISFPNYSNLYLMYYINLKSDYFFSDMAFLLFSTIASTVNP